MEHRYDINDFYMIEHVCSRCGNICAKTDDRCTVCGDTMISRVTVCRSCLEYWYCGAPGCGWSSHVETMTCPGCGRPAKSCCTMIPEDHWGLPIPSREECCGTLRDDDEGACMARNRFV